ncbi:MAG: enoyl-CoA hydratase/isomerase family protein [Gammaproteobacteria bacterium]|nr:enoyl-CoA hydratase/isomerase family protein [Gammaproteobacteria bacterium]
MVNLEKRDAVAIVRFDRGEKLNAFNQALIQELTETAYRFEFDQTTRAIVLTGAPNAFSAGMDLGDEMWNLSDADDLERRQMFHGGVRLCDAWERIPQVTIAAIEGMAVGAGVALALACDWRVAAKDSFLSVPEVKVGINLQWGALPRLITLVGPARAKRICLLCERLSAAQALDWGLLDAICVADSAVQEALLLAQQVAERPAAAVRMVKEAVNATAYALHRATSFADADQSQLSAGFSDAQQARAKFLSKD